MRASEFLRDVLKHLRGPVHVIWDRDNIHRGEAIRALQCADPRLRSHWLPSHAPELNPVEFVWILARYGKGANDLAHDVSERHDWLKRLLGEA